MLSLINANKDILLISNFLIEELETNLSKEAIVNMLNPFEGIMEKIKYNNNQIKEAINIAKQRKLPKGDALHAILARDNKAILITRDRHFDEITDITIPQKPEDLI